MDKFGVPETNNFDKTAGRKSVCAACGKPLTNSTPPTCPSCGTKPVEEQFLLELDNKPTPS